MGIHNTMRFQNQQTIFCSTLWRYTIGMRRREALQFSSKHHRRRELWRGVHSIPLRFTVVWISKWCGVYLHEIILSRAPSMLLFGQRDHWCCDAECFCTAEMARGVRQSQRHGFMIKHMWISECVCVFGVMYIETMKVCLYTNSSLQGDGQQSTERLSKRCWKGCCTTFFFSPAAAYFFFSSTLYFIY